MYACMHACMYGCMHACMHACMYVCMYVRIYATLSCCLRRNISARCRWSASFSLCIRSRFWERERERARAYTHIRTHTHTSLLSDQLFRNSKNSFFVESFEKRKKKWKKNEPRSPCVPCREFWEKKKKRKDEEEERTRRKRPRRPCVPCREFCSSWPPQSHSCAAARAQCPGTSCILCHIIIHTMSHHHTYYVTSSYILCHIISSIAFVRSSARSMSWHTFSKVRWCDIVCTMMWHGMYDDVT